MKQIEGYMITFEFAPNIISVNTDSAAYLPQVSRFSSILEKEHDASPTLGCISLCTSRAIAP
jgi:hypothetical protein